MTQENEVPNESMESGSELHLSEYWNVIVKRKLLIAIVAAIALAFSMTSALMSKPTYKATAVVNVEKDKSGLYDVGSSQTLFWDYNPEFLPTQIRLMKSRGVAEEVVRRLKLHGKGDPASKDAQTAVTRAAVGIQGGLETNLIRGTNLVELSFTASTPERAADVVNTAAEAYIDTTLQGKFQVINQASKMITAQIEQLRTELDAKEKELQAYGRQKGIISTDPQTNSTLQNLDSLNKDYASAVADRVTKEARYFSIQNARPDTVVDSVGNNLISQLRNKQAELEREYAEKSNLFKPDWPALQQLKVQVEKGRQELEKVTNETVSKARESARNDYQAALRREQSLQAVLRGQKLDAMDATSSAVEYNNLKTEVETKRTLLDTLLKREAETQLSSRLRDERISSIRIVDRALPPSVRSSPSYKKSATSGLLMGLLLGVGLAFLLEYLDRSLRTMAQVEQYLKLPALGSIPSVDAGHSKSYGYYGSRRRKKKAQESEEKVAIELLPHDQPRSTVAEAYRAVRAALLLSRAGGVKSIVVTSSLPSEGKTSTAVNLAVVIGQLQKKVLLVDGDLHKPRLHEVLRVSNRQGLVSILAENLQPTKAIVETQLPNVSVLPAGPSSPNPSGLISSEAMSIFLEFARQNYDFVIIDSPPVSPIADALLLGHQTDGVVLCIEGGATPRELVAKVRDKLLRANVRILGALINNLEPESSGYSYYYKYYGRQYGDTNAGYTEEIKRKAM